MDKSSVKFLAIGSVIGGGAITLWRGIESETDGMSSLLVALAISGILVLTYFVLTFLMKRDDHGGKPTSRKGIWLLSGLLASGSMVWTLAPTEASRVRELLQENQALYKKKTEQLLTIGKAVEALPDVKYYPGGIIGEVPALKDWSPEISAYRDFYVEDNGSGAFDTTYVELSEILNLHESSQLKFELVGIGGRREYPYELFIDELRDCDSDSPPFYAERQVEKHAVFLESLRYIVVVEMGEAKLPYITDAKEFLPGFYPGNAHVFEMETAKHLGSFSFAGTNGTEINYSYEKNQDPSLKTGSAMSALEDDLKENTGLAFLHRLKQVSPNAKTGHDDDIKEMPFKEMALALAFQFAEKGAGGKAIQLDDETKLKILDIYQEKGKISAIKEIRTITGASLKDSKDYIDSLTSSFEVE